MEEKEILRGKNDLYFGQQKVMFIKFQLLSLFTSFLHYNAFLFVI